MPHILRKRKRVAESFRSAPQTRFALDVASLCLGRSAQARHAMAIHNAGPHPARWDLQSRSVLPIAKAPTHSARIPFGEQALPHRLPRMRGHRRFFHWGASTPCYALRRSLRRNRHGRHKPAAYGVALQSD